MNNISQAEKSPAAGASRLLLPVDFQPNPDKDILMSTTTTTSSLSFAARSSNALLHRTIENCLSQYRRQFSVLESSSRKQHFEAVATTLVNLFVGDGFRFIVVVTPSAQTSTSTGPSYYQVPLQEAIRAVQNHLMTRSFTLQAQDSSSTPSQGVVQAQNNNTSHGSSADIIISKPKNFNSNAPASTSSSTTPALPLITHATTNMKNHSSLQETTNNPTAASSSATTTTATSRAPVIHADQSSCSSGGGASAFDRWSPNTMHAATTLSMLSQNHQHSNEDFSTLNDGSNHPTSTFDSTTTPAGPRQLCWTSASSDHPNHPQGTTSTMAPATISPETVSTFMSSTYHDDNDTMMIHCEDLDSESLHVDDDGSLIKCFPIGWASADYQDFVEDHAALYAKAKMGTKFDLCRSLLQSVLDDDGYTSFVNLGGRGRQGEHETLSIEQAALKLQKSFQAVNVKTPAAAHDDDEESDDSSSTEDEADEEEDQKVFQVGLGNPNYQALIDDHVEAYANHTAGSKMDFCRALLNQLIEQEGYTTFLTAGRHDQDHDDEPMSLQQVAVKLQKAFGYAMFKATQAAAEEESEYDASSDIEQDQEEETDDESVTPPSRAVSSSKKNNKKQKVFELGRRSEAYQSFIEEHVQAYADTQQSKMEFCRSLLNHLVQKEGYASFVNTGHGLAQEPISFQEAVSKLQKSLKYAVTKLQAAAATIQEPLPDFEFGPASQAYQNFVAEHLEDYKAADQRKKLAYCRELVSDLMEEYQIVARPFHHKDLEDDEDMDTLKELSEEEATAKLKQSFYHQSRKRKHGGSATSTAVAAGPTKKPKKKLASKPKPNNNKTKKAQELPLSLEDADLGPFDVVYGRGRDNHNPFLLQKVAEHAPVLAQADNKRQSMIEFVETLMERDGFRFIHEPNRDARRELVTSADRIVSKIQNDFRRLSQRQESNKTVVFGRGVKSDLNPDFLRLVKANGRGYQKAGNKQIFMRDFAQSLLDDGWTFFRDSGEQVDDADRLAHLKIQNDFRRLLVNKTKGMSNCGE